LTAKEYLQQAYIIDRKIKLDAEKLAAARSEAYGRAVRYDSDGTKATPKGNTAEAALLRVAELEERLKADTDKLYAKRSEIEQAINSVPDEIQREVLTRRYLLYQRWDVIAEKMCYSERQIFRIHGCALKAVEKMSVNVSK